MALGLVMEVTGWPHNGQHGMNGVESSDEDEDKFQSCQVDNQ